jgi:hypothetical protein
LSSLRVQRLMLATLVLTNNRLEAWRHLSPRTTPGPRWKQPTHDLRSSNRKLERLIDSHRHSSCQFHYLTKLRMFAMKLDSTTKEGPAGPLDHLKSILRNVDATIQDVNSEGVVVGTHRCTKRLNFTSMAGPKKKATIKTGAVAVASGAGDENAS